MHAGTDYYMLGQCTRTRLVHLALFYETANKCSDRWRGELVALSSAELEEGLEAELIEVVKPDHSLPPWLSSYEGLSLEALEDQRSSAIKSYSERIDNRYRTIAGLVESERDLLSSHDIRMRIRTHAGTLTPKQRPDRVMLWYLAYQCFGQDRRALANAFGNIGSWDRNARSADGKKLGRHNITEGKHSGHSAVSLSKKIAESYIKRADPQETMTAIYYSALRLDFGCKVRTENRKKFVVHPKGDPFPTLGQFRYHVYKAISPDTIARTKLGGARSRRAVDPNKGKFSERVGNLLEACETDCAYAKELPRQLLSSEPGLPLVVCRIVDVASGCVFAIGFSYGGENADAYRSAYFFAAAPKALIGRLFGLPLTEDHFPCSGLPDNCIADRGPGASSKLEATGKDGPAIREMTPSWSGQSKATVESSHPRSVSTEGAPSFVLSNLNVFEMTKGVFIEAQARNESSDARDRLTPEMIAKGVPANPNGIARFLQERGRDHSRSIPVDQAIRNYLKKVTFKAKRTGLHLFHIRYGSDAYHATGLHLNSKKNQDIPVEGYVFPLSVRFAWIEYQGRLLEVGAMLPIRDDTTQLYLSIYDVEANAEALRALKREQAAHGQAAAIEAEIEFKEATGKELNAGRTVSGRPPSRDETRATEAPTGALGQKSA